MKTIEKLLAEGKAMLQEQETEARTQRQEEDRRTREAWGLLCQAAFRELGELAESLDPTTPPEDFNPRESYSLLLAPFGVACLGARFASGRDNLWYPVAYAEYNRDLYRVTSSWRLEWDHDGDEGNMAWRVRAETCQFMDSSSLPAAVLFAYTSSQDYKRREEEAKARPAPAWVRKKEEKQPLALTPAEERLIIALREITEEGREE